LIALFSVIRGFHGMFVSLGAQFGVGGGIVFIRGTGAALGGGIVVIGIRTFIKSVSQILCQAFMGA
jgi:hypothetical protein